MSNFAKHHPQAPLKLPWMEQCCHHQHLSHGQGRLIVSRSTGGCLRWASRRRHAAPNITASLVFVSSLTHPKSVDRALELAGGEEEAALALLLDGAVDSTQEQEEEQQQQHVRPVSVSFSKATARAALPQTRPRGQSRSSSRESADARNFSPQDEPHPTLPPLPLPAVAAAAALDAVAEGSPVVAAAVVEDSPNDWVLLQHPDDRSVVAYGNIVTHEFSLQLPADGGGSSAGGGSEGC